ncbi:MAG TPA: cytochrome c maturation protein CcmE [Acidimicrobiales bacterium]|nr:cytochrome c maturation protein CcmE [Acidimicrobiales bacterium]
MGAVPLPGAVARDSAITRDDGAAVAALRASRARRTRRRLSLTGLVLAAALGFLVYKALTSAIVYFKTAKEAVASRAQLGGSTFQIEGVVVRGSVRTINTSRIDFTIASGDVRVPVENSGAPPQLFQPGIPVVLVGHFVGSTDRFASDQILVKHSNAYIAAHPRRVRGVGGAVVR